MALGWVSKDRHEREMSRAKVNFEHRLSRTNELHKEEIEGLRATIAEANILKSRGKHPGDGVDQYTIQVFADAKILHQLVRGNRKNLVRILAGQFAYEAERMLLALSGLERIPMLPDNVRGRDWWMMDERGTG